uniref:TRAF family member associated NFKB activator n=1 Tax=Pavo cristatus TaxID=9049 RepID=A0A8C9FYL8_PAVCR
MSLPEGTATNVCCVPSPGKSEAHKKNNECSQQQPPVLPRMEYKQCLAQAVPLIPEETGKKTIFQEMKEECHRICVLAREQTDQLSKFKIKPEPETEIQFSMPIQCTDKTDEQAEELFKPRVIQDINRGASCITSITPRGVGQDEDNNSVESLSKFNVKFPPTDNDSAFLQSTQEKVTVPCSGIAENMLQDHHFNREHRDRAVNLSKLEPNSFEAHGVDLVTSALQSLTTVDKTNPPNRANMPIENTRDKTCLKTADTAFTFISKHASQGAPEAIFPSLEAAGTTVRGPHQVSFPKYCIINRTLFLLSTTT